MKTLQLYIFAYFLAAWFAATGSARFGSWLTDIGSSAWIDYLSPVAIAKHIVEAARCRSFDTRATSLTLALTPTIPIAPRTISYPAVMHSRTDFFRSSPDRFFARPA